jgi:hypothetical protein
VFGRIISKAARWCVAINGIVNENWLIELERAEFMKLLRHEKTQARIVHTLTTGKPLRN